MAYKSKYTPQLNLFEEPKADLSTQFKVGDRWLVFDRHPHIYVQIGERVIRAVNEFNVTFARPSDPPLSQHCLAHEDFLAIARRLNDSSQPRNPVEDLRGPVTSGEGASTRFPDTVHARNSKDFSDVPF